MEMTAGSTAPASMNSSTVCIAVEGVMEQNVTSGAALRKDILATWARRLVVACAENDGVLQVGASFTSE